MDTVLYTKKTSVAVIQDCDKLNCMLQLRTVCSEKQSKLTIDKHPEATAAQLTHNVNVTFAKGPKMVWSDLTF